MKELLKTLADACFFVAVFPTALLCGFGRWAAMFEWFAQAWALCPGLTGVYARRAFYGMTLRSCSRRCCIAFGSFFAHREAVVGPGVYIGAYCILGRVRIGANTQIASGVHVLSGRHQHARDAEGRLGGAETGTFETVTIGADCWIGTGAIVMADVGDGSTVGAGSVVTKPLPAGVVAVGSPARVLKPAVADRPADAG